MSIHTTVFDTPILSSVLRWISLGILKVLGWRIEGERPRLSKYVLLAAPHTSNWDWPYTLFFGLAFRVKAYWVGKASLFRWPFGYLFRWTGGIPVDRSKSQNLVEQCVQHFENNDELILMMMPEGTRKKRNHWKSGFYYIALGAKVPIVMGFVDYKRKVEGFGPTIMPSGDIEADMKIIREFYQGISGKFPDQMGDPVLEKPK